MPASKQGAASASRGDRKDSGARPPTPSESHDMKQHKTGRKDSTSVREDKRKDGQAGGEDGGKAGGGLFGSIFNTVKNGLASARNAEANDEQPSQDPRSTNNAQPQESSKNRTPKSSPTKDQQPSRQGSTAADNNSRHTPKRKKDEARSAEVSPSRAPTNRSEAQPPKKAKRADTQEGRDKETGDTRIQSKAAGTRDPAEPAREHRGSHKTDENSTDNDRSAESEQQPQKHARDRLHDITNELRGGSSYAGSEKIQKDSETEKGIDAKLTGGDRTRGEQRHASRTHKPENGTTQRDAGVQTTLKQTKKDRRDAPRTPNPKNNAATRDAGVQTSRKLWDEHSCTGTTTAGASIHTLPRTSRPLSSEDEIVETSCANPNCRDWIAFNPKTRELLDLSLLPPEVCPFCGQPWPRSRPLTEKMIEIVKERLEKSPYKDVYCERCAAERAREQEQNVDEGVQVDPNELEEDSKAGSDVDKGGNVDVGVQVDERDLQANDPNWRGDHYCKPLDFERDTDNRLPQLFPDDPKRRKGTKRALLVGINYSAQPHELRGCRNDVVNMYHYLQANGYKDENIDILLDIRPFKPPTKVNIMKYMHMLVDEARAGDNLFLHYSGHGGQTKDRTGDELDGEDECIYPVDYKCIPKGRLIDDELHDILVEIPKGVHLTCLFDSCHSGSVLDLPYVLDNEGTMQRANFRKPRSTEHIERLNKCGTIILWSGCKDTQTSADEKIGGASVGAMSYAFIQANCELLERHTKNPTKTAQTLLDAGNSNDPKIPKAWGKDVEEYTYDELLERIREILHLRSQVPQLSSTENIEPYERLVHI